MGLGFLVCLTLGMTLASAGSAGAQTSPYCQYPGAAANYPQYSCIGATTTSSVLAGSGTTTGPTNNLAATGETAAIPLAAAAGLMIIVLGARQLRQRANN